MDKLARTTGGMALIAAPVTLVVSELLYGNAPDDPAGSLAHLRAHESAWHAATLLGLLAAALFIPVIVTLAALTGRGRGRSWAVVGAALGALGVSGYAAHTGAFVVVGQMAEQSADRVAMARLLDAIDGSPTMGIVFMLFLVGLYLGLVLLVVGAWRARCLPLWSMLSVTGAVLLASVPLVDGSEYVAQALVIAGLGGAGLVVLRGSPSEASHHTSEVRADA